MAAKIRAFVLAALVLSAQGGSLSGRVSNSVSGAGIPGVRFRICQYASGTIHCGDTNYNIVSDISGIFHIGALSDGEYIMLNLEARGFQLAVSNSIHVSGDSQFELRLAPNANIRGRVFDPEGNPAAGVSVTLSNRSGPGLPTNENGEFLIEGVGAGPGVILTATPSPQAVAKTASKDGTRLVTTYYPSAIRMDQAARINVTGVDASYDVHLQSAPARIVRGVVIGAGGKPAPHVLVTISQRESGPIAFVRGSPPPGALPPRESTGAQPVNTGADGTFAFAPVIEGDWTLAALIPSGRETTLGTARVSISSRDAGAGEIPDVQIRMVQPFNVEVTADWGDAGPPKTSANAPFVSAIPLDPGIPRMGGGSTGEPGEPQQFRLFPGRYFIGEGANGQLSATGFYAAAAILDGRDVLNQVVELSGPASIKMIYKSGGGNVRGTVEKGPNAAVILLAGATPEAIVGYMGHCDETGAFVVADLPPGEYTAVALTQTFVIDPRTPDFATAAIRDGKRVKVEAGGAAQVELRIALTQ